MVPALVLNYFVMLILFLFLAVFDVSFWGIVVVMTAAIIVDRELFQLRGLIDDGDDDGEGHHRDYVAHHHA